MNIRTSVLMVAAIFTTPLFAQDLGSLLRKVPAKIPTRQQVEEAAKPESAKSAELPDFMKRAHVVQPPGSLWCWLACAEMVHRHHGRFGDQYTQVGMAKRIQGIDNPNDPKAKAGALLQLAAALCPDAKVDFESMSQLIAHLIMGDGWEKVLADKKVNINLAAWLELAECWRNNGKGVVVDDIEDKQPVVALLGPKVEGGPGHAVVLYSVKWTDGGIGIENVLGKKRRQIEFVGVADPSPEGNRPTMTGNELNDEADRCLSKRSAEALLKALDGALGGK